MHLPAIRFSAPAQVRLMGKGRMERLCPLWSETIQRLRHMLRDRLTDEKADEPLFLNAARRPLTRFGLRFIVRQYVNRVATSHPEVVSKSISPHTFRHYGERYKMVSDDSKPDKTSKLLIDSLTI